MGSRKRDPAKLRRCHPFALDSRRGTGGQKNRRMDHVSGKRIRNPCPRIAPGSGRTGGEKRKVLPTILRMGLGKPDAVATSNDQNVFLLAGGGGFRAAGIRPFPAGRTTHLKGAGRAMWISRQADEGSQFHQGLVMKAGVSTGHKVARQSPQESEVWRLALACRQAPQNPGHISIESGGRFPKGDAGDGAGGVVADSGKSAKHLRVGGQVFSRKANHRLSQSVQKPGPAVVAQSLPHPENPGKRRSGQPVPSRKGLHPASIVRNDGGDPCLLAHELGHRSSVRRWAGAPGQGAAVFPVPGPETGKSPADFGFDGRAGGSSLGSHG